MNIEEIKNYFLNRCDELISLSERGDAWVFVCCSAMLDYLTQMTTNTSGRTAYINFVNEFLSQINSNYKEFRFQSGETDLPTQMYVILRCGIVHKFSFIPDNQQISNHGRERPILLGHEKKSDIHFGSYTKNGMDSVIFTAEQFSKDIKDAVNLIFTMTQTNETLKNNIINHVTNYPPIQGKFE